MRDAGSYRQDAPDGEKDSRAARDAVALRPLDGYHVVVTCDAETMTPRHSTLILSALVLAAACSTIFPAARKGTAANSLEPRIEKTAARRRPGSDVTLPRSADPDRLIGALIPCAAADSAAARPRIATDCQHVDPTGDVLRPQVDTTTRKSP